MKFRKLIIGLLCMALMLAMTACGGSKTEEKKEEAKEETQEEEKQDESIEISGTEFSSGDLTLTVPEGWEVSSADNDWAANEHVKVLETEYMKESSGSPYGDSYVDIEVSDYTKKESAYNEDALKKASEEYDDEEALPQERLLNSNIYTCFREYTYVGDSAEDWTYLAYAADGKLIEIRAYLDGDIANDDSRAAIRSILASLTIGGQSLSAEP